MMTDPISDLLTQVRNAGKARLKKVDVPSSHIKVAIVDILKKHGFVKNFNLFRDGQKGVLRVYLKYTGKGKHVIHGIERVSKPSRRVYSRHDELAKVLNGMGISVVSTSQGIVTDGEARENKVGGEVICRVW